MSTPETAPTPPLPVVDDSRLPNQYHLSGDSIQITYYPTGAGSVIADGPIILAYQDAHGSLVFRGKQVQAVPVADLGTFVTVTIQTRPDADRTTATLLIPTVVLAAGQPTMVHTELITTVHDSTLTGIGDPQRDHYPASTQRDHYTVTELTGEASQGPLPG